MTNPWLEAFQRPARLADRSASEWFAGIADLLLNRTHLVIAGRAHRITECEFYYRGPDHDDPFAHGDPIQAHAGRWYFHKTAGTYRGGSYKGVDVTFGDGTARGGILIRGVEWTDGNLIDGPSLVVDRILRSSEVGSVAELDRAIAGRQAWDDSTPLHFQVVADQRLDMLACARVGLSLRKAEPGSTRPAYLTRPYRFLTEPRQIAKGKPQMIVSLHRLGRSAAEIREITRSPARSTAVLVAEYEKGRRGGCFEDYFGKEIGPRELSRLHGIADRDALILASASSALPPQTP